MSDNRSDGFGAADRRTRHRFRCRVWTVGIAGGGQYFVDYTAGVLSEIGARCAHHAQTIDTVYGYTARSNRWYRMYRADLSELVIINIFPLFFLPAHATHNSESFVSSALTLNSGFVVSDPLFLDSVFGIIPCAVVHSLSMLIIISIDFFDRVIHSSPVGRSVGRSSHDSRRYVIPGGAEIRIGMSSAADSKSFTLTTASKPPASICVEPLTEHDVAGAAQCFANTFQRENQTIACGDTPSDLLAFANGYFPDALKEGLSAVAVSVDENNSADSTGTDSKSQNRCSRVVAGFGAAWDLNHFIAKTVKELAHTIEPANTYNSRPIDSFVLYCIFAFIEKIVSHSGGGGSGGGSGASAAAVRPTATAIPGTPPTAHHNIAVAALENGVTSEEPALTVPEGRYLFIDLMGTEKEFGGRCVGQNLVRADRYDRVSRAFHTC